MKTGKFFKFFLIFTILESLVGCRTVRVVEQVPVHVHDTLRLTQTLRDSIFIDHFREVTQKDDTIYITEQGIGEVDGLNAKVYSSHGQIVVEGADDNMVTLYDITGRVLETKQDDYTPLRFDAPVSGTYMIKIGKYPARKVVVIR
jgi:hypothetical protein